LTPGPFIRWPQELLKLRKKITNTVQVLTHLKEKLQFVQAENQVRKQQLAEVEQEVAQVGGLVPWVWLVVWWLILFALATMIKKMGCA